MQTERVVTVNTGGFNAVAPSSDGGDNSFKNLRSRFGEDASWIKNEESSQRSSKNLERKIGKKIEKK